MKSLLVFLTGASLCASAFGVVTFTTFGPGDSYSVSNGYIFRPVNSSVAAQFTATQSGPLRSVRLAARTEVPTVYAATIHEDSGNVMGRTVATMASGAPTGPHILTMISGGQPALVAGKTYWIQVTPEIGATAWLHNDQQHRGRIALTRINTIQTDYFDNQLMPAFEVNVVPEPATMAALGLGVLALARRRRLRN